MVSVTNEIPVNLRRTNLRCRMKSCCKEAMEPKHLTPDTPPKKRGFKVWLKRLGWAGFFFFLVKGLIWLAVFYGGARLIGCGD